jgi:hypothetical protein
MFLNEMNEILQCGTHLRASALRLREINSVMKHKYPSPSGN